MPQKKIEEYKGVCRFLRKHEMMAETIIIITITIIIMTMIMILTKIIKIIILYNNSNSVISFRKYIRAKLNCKKKEEQMQ